MGYTKRQLLDAAIEEIGLDPVEFDVTSGEYQKFLRRLEAMINTWSGEGIPLSYNAASNPEDINIDQESGLPDWAYEAVYLNLALAIAPSIGKQSLPDTRKRAYATKNIARRNRALKFEMQYPDTFPVGSGNKPFSKRYNRFFREKTYTTEIE